MNIRRLEAELNNAYDIIDMLRKRLRDADPTNDSLIISICESLWDALDAADCTEELYREALRNGW